jgi:lipooligosaccharide transport system ATP-binding protein
MVSCQSPITAGTIRVFGRDAAAEPREVKAMLGVCPQDDNLDTDFSVRRNLLVYARYHGLPAAEAGPRADELLAAWTSRTASGPPLPGPPGEG